MDNIGAGAARALKVARRGHEAPALRPVNEGMVIATEVVMVAIFFLLSSLLSNLFLEVEVMEGEEVYLSTEGYQEMREELDKI